MCAQYNPYEMYYFDNFKVYNNELYALEYPDAWIMSHKQGTGPECYNCLDHASWRGVLIGYCGNCATKYENYSRGPGFCGKAVEHKTPNCSQQNSAYYTYLKNANLQNIGNIEFNPCHTIYDHIVWKKTINDEHDEYECEYDAYSSDSTESTNSTLDEYNEPTSHTISEGFNLQEMVEQNATIKIGHTIEYISNNQMGWRKYKVINKNGKKDILLLDYVDFM